MGESVVDIRLGGRHPAAGKQAPAVAVAEESSQRRGRDTAVSEVQDDTRLRVVEYPPPARVRGERPLDLRRDRAKSHQLGRIVIHSRERADRVKSHFFDDLCMRSC